MPDSPTIPGVSTATLYERVSAEFNRLGGPALPERPAKLSTDDFVAKWRAEGGERGDVATQSWSHGKNSMLDEIHLMLRFLCRPHMNAVPGQVSVKFLLSLVEAPEPDDRPIYMKALDETHTLTLMYLRDLRALVRFVLVNLPERVEVPPEVPDPRLQQAVEASYQRVAERARRDALAELKVAVHEQVGDKTMMIPKMIGLIDEVMRRDYNFPGEFDATRD